MFFVGEKMEYIPSYENYSQIINAIKSTHKLADFHSYRQQAEWIVIRHDIEFDIEKAVAMARIEADAGVKATYLVQIGSEAYNAFSDDNLARLNEIIDLGHEVGLHYRQTGTLSDTLNIESQLDVLQKMLPRASRIVACHRPKAGSPYNEYSGNFINCYSEPFFYLTDKPQTAPTRYVSDSKWRWNYGEPIYQFFRDTPKIQFLTHPFQWSAKGNPMGETFHRLEMFKRSELLETFDREYERFAEIYFE